VIEMTSRYASASVLSLLLVACGGARESGAGPRPAPTASPAPSADYEPPTVQGTIRRSDLVAVLDAGLGRFLQGVQIEASLDDGRFVGFRLVSLYPDDPRFRSIDLAPGDVVVRVNGQSVERPEQAFQVWDGLRVASQLLVEYLRAGERREIRFDIVD
jgi:hypothetical protein